MTPALPPKERCQLGIIYIGGKVRIERGLSKASRWARHIKKRVVGIVCRRTNLALDLFAGPSSSIACAVVEVLVRTGLPRHGSKEVMAEVFPEVTLGECLGNVSNDTARRSEETLSAVAVLLDAAQKVKDGVHVWNDEVSLVALLHRNNAAVPSIHDTLTKRGDVVDHLVVALCCEGDLTSLLEYLSNDWQVRLESTVDCVRDVTKALENGRLELVAKRGASEVVEQRVHERIAEGLDILAKGSSDVGDETNSHGAQSRLLLVVQGVVQERRESLHVLLEVLLQSGGN
jgi:hypothetical protein